MPREITDHRVHGLNDILDVSCEDEPGYGGACHEYRITGYSQGGGISQSIIFQRGPVVVCGINGVSNESLLAIIIDRLQGFQSGSYACRENAIALRHLGDALGVLHMRTIHRIARGVEGTSIK